MAGGNRTSPTKRRAFVKPKKKQARAALADAAVPQAPPIHRFPSAPSTAPLERCISRILLLRFKSDVARLYSSRLTRICQNILPALMLDIVVVAGPGWVAANAASEDMKAFLRGPIAMDLRQAGERVATKSVLWSYTAIRHFAISHDVEICPHSGVHSMRLLPYLPQLEAHRASLEAMPPPQFSKPPSLNPSNAKLEVLQTHCRQKVKRLLAQYSEQTPGAQYDSYVESITKKKRPGLDESKLPPTWKDWHLKLTVGYDLLVKTVWEVANEFNPADTDHLGEVCEPTVREDEEEYGHKSRSGKGREWDGRGAGVVGWNTADEEDVWESKLDFGFDERGFPDDIRSAKDLIEMRYVKAEREKELGNRAFKHGRYTEAVEAYTRAHSIEPEVAHYQLNLAAAHLKLANWMEAEQACTKSLSLHRSEKGFWRRAKARQMLGKRDEAIQDLKDVLKLQPRNTEAIAELESLASSSPPLDIARGGIGGSGSTSSSNWNGAHGSSAFSGGSSSSSSKFPFEFADSDFTKLKVIPSKRIWDLSDPNSRESFLYPTWDTYEIQLV
ncbi:hypothetical protein FRB99_001375 [Tulasnella sp. 403]|nr:hypothetical protein FRB99_001375 [Tulasnella sp. 403]